MARTNGSLTDELLIMKARVLYQEREDLMWRRSVLLKKREQLAYYRQMASTKRTTTKWAPEIFANQQEAYTLQVIIFEGANEREYCKEEVLRRGLATGNTFYQVIGVWERV